MPIHISISQGILYPQPNGTVEIDKEGKWTAKLTFLCHRNSAISLTPRPGTPHPEIAFVSVIKSSIAYSEGDVAEISCEYSGAEDNVANEKVNATYSTGLSVSEEPLLSHRRYKMLPEFEVEALRFIIAGKDKDEEGNKMRDFIESEKGLEALAKIERGESSYYSPKITWKEKWVRKHGVASIELYKVGCIDTPSGPAPGLGSMRNWLRNGVTQNQEGKSYTIEMEWLASNPGGWDPDIYVEVTS